MLSQSNNTRLKTSFSFEYFIFLNLKYNSDIFGYCIFNFCLEKHNVISLYENNEQIFHIFRKFSSLFLKYRYITYILKGRFTMMLKRFC